MRDFRPPLPPDSDDPEELKAWMLAAHDKFEEWGAAMDRELKRMEQVSSFLAIAVPTSLGAITLYYIARRQWWSAAIEGTFAVGLVVFNVWIARRTARRIAARQAEFAALMAYYDHND